MDTMRGSSPLKVTPATDSPEQLLDSFKAAALSVTKLYKTSAAAQAKSRLDGYQDCLDDLLAFLDKRHIGLGDGEGWQIRKWATERLDGRDSGPQVSDDEDESDHKTESISSPDLPRLHVGSQHPTARHESTPLSTPLASHSPVTVESVADESHMSTVPTQDNFTFQSPHPYPQESYLNLANLDLSDSMRTNDGTIQGSAAPSVSQPTRLRRDKRGSRPRNATTAHLGKGAGQKRTINFAELFDVGGLNFGKDTFGREGKRSRHI